MKLDRSSDPVWWALAGLLGLGSLWLPRLLSLDSDTMSRTLLAEGGLFFTGAIIGAFRPRRVWRWPLAAFFAFVLADLARVAGALDSVVWTYLTQNASMYFLHSLPVLAGAYVGCFLSKEGMN